MRYTFHEHHLFTILDAFEKQTAPLDFFLRRYFLQHKAIGSKDRKRLKEAIYGMIRWRGLLDYLAEKPLSWQTRYARYQSFNPSDYLSQEKIPPHIRVSFPKFLFERLEASYGLERTLELCLVSNTPAPTTIRVNSLKTTRKGLLAQWNFATAPCSHSRWGATFHDKVNFFALPEFQQGLFEVQDEGSQLIADLVRATPQEHVLDFCAGSGGKSLAIAANMQNKGQIYLHDIRSFALEEAKKRLRRAGVQNAQVLLADDPKKASLKNHFDWILVDAPCSGTGTLRRNPDAKWKLDAPTLLRLKEQQREIFSQALEFLHPKGRIVYATCSILPEENEGQVAFFQEQLPLQLVEPPFQASLQKEGMDGFFGAIFTRTS